MKSCSKKNSTSATLADLVDAARMNNGLNGSEQIASFGPAVELGPRAALSLAMVLP
ncbi:hypothetical protein BSY16_4587 (plasmid) [Sinorhizobium sp. RAC02]|nr:hypothetical protein BSY16_4587 [Sinorhizobium sp. RAC02]